MNVFTLKNAANNLLNYSFTGQWRAKCKISYIEASHVRKTTNFLNCWKKLNLKFYFILKKI